METRLITLTTDFGYKDPFVGIMKGVIFGINANANVIDLTHGIPPQDLMAGALALRHSFPFFPTETIHVAVVDPGVGTERRPLLIQSKDCFFIGPDNGILSLVLAGEEPRRIIQLSNETYHLRPNSGTFHGRDIFAPVAGYLSLGIPPQDFGVQVEGFEILSWPKVVKTGCSIQGEIIYVDGYGNLVTNVKEHDLEGIAPEDLMLSLGNLTVRGLARNYASGGGKDYVLLINSWGLLEISSFKGNAHLGSGGKIGDIILIRDRQKA
ncbi:MAG: S-adenosyl-l-methionine hydroxide adenosyltransferase family protein [Candidatus Binatia bacterium]